LLLACVQLPGSMTPGTGIKVEVAAVRGVQSHGMLCSPADLGWDATANKELAAVPGGLSLGDACPAERPMVRPPVTASNVAGANSAPAGFHAWCCHLVWAKRQSRQRKRRS